MTSRSRSPSRSGDRQRHRDRMRSGSPRSYYSDSRSPRPRRNSRSRSRSFTPRPRHESRYRSISPRQRRYRSRSRSQSRSRSRSWSHDYSDGRGRSASPTRFTKLVVERLSKNVNEDHLYEIFGQYGRIRDLDLPMSKFSNTNRGTAYILFEHSADAEAAIAHMHEAQIDGSTINVSIVLPCRLMSPAPPLASFGTNVDPRAPMNGPAHRGGFQGGGVAGASDFNSGLPRGPSASKRFGPRSDVYHPSTQSVSRSPSGDPLFDEDNGGGERRFRSPSRNSLLSRHRSKSPATTKRGPSRRNRSPNDRHHDGDRLYTRSGSRD